MKAVFHKGCSCFQCLRGLRGRWGHDVQTHAEHRLRRIAKQQLDAVVRGTLDEDEVIIAPIGQDYTD